MTKHKITVHLPDADELLAGLDLDEVHPPYRAAREDFHAAQRYQDEVRVRLQRATEAAEVTIPRAVAEGRQPDQALADALEEREVAAALIEPAARRFRAADRARDRAKSDASAALRRRIRERAAPLHKAVEDLVPVLRSLIELERRLVGAHPIRDPGHAGNVTARLLNAIAEMEVRRG